MRVGGGGERILLVFLWDGDDGSVGAPSVIGWRSRFSIAYDGKTVMLPTGEIGRSEKGQRMTTNILEVVAENE